MISRLLKEDLSFFNCSEMFNRLFTLPRRSRSDDVSESRKRFDTNDVMIVRRCVAIDAYMRSLGSYQFYIIFKMLTLILTE